MAGLEDEVDAQATRGAEKENVEEMEEFDDSKKKEKEEVGGEGGEEGEEEKSQVSKKSKTTAGGEEKEEEAMCEEEFAAFQTQLGPDVSAIEARLRPVERYAFRFR